MSEQSKSQISVSYDQYEDRLLLQMTVNEHCNRVWLTRRILAGISASMDQVGAMFEEPDANLAPQDKAIREFMQENEFEQTDFSEPFKAEGMKLHPADGPLLAVKISFTPLDNGRIRLVFENTEKKEMPFSLRRHDFRLLFYMISEAAAKGDWMLDFNPGKKEIELEPMVLH